VASPMEQFEIRPIVPLHIGDLDISFTNASLWMCIVAAAAALFLTAGASSRRLVPTRMQSIAEMSYVFVADMIRSAAGIEGLKFFPSSSRSSCLCCSPISSASSRSSVPSP